jgi:hypothetical protein
MIVIVLMLVRVLLLGMPLIRMMLRMISVHEIYFCSCIKATKTRFELSIASST